MQNPNPQAPARPRTCTALAGGCLVGLCCLLSGMTLLFGYQQTASRILPTRTPTVTPTPHILVNEPHNKSNVEYDDFSSNRNDWGLSYSNGKLQVLNGKLILQANFKEAFTIGTSRRLSPSGSEYYLQADFSTDSETPAYYGLIFASDFAASSFYSFGISPQAGGFRAFRYKSGKWEELIPFTRASLNPYPQPTTLSVDFDRGQIEFYINGKLVSEYSDENFLKSKGLGVFVGDTDYRLCVDDFFVYDK